MDLRQLQVFHTVMETRSASRAARILGVSQPAVSTLLKRLEERLGIALFARERNRLEPTPEAVLLMEHVSHALGSISKVRNAVDDIQQADEIGRTQVGTTVTNAPIVWSLLLD